MVEKMKEDASLARGGIQVISRAAAVLRALREDPNGLSLGQIAERVGLARSTVQRIVAALQDERLVFAAGSSGIRLGPEVTALAEAVKFNVVDICRPYLVELVKVTDETADLSVLRGQSMIFLDQVSGTQRLRAVSAIGDVFPLTDTANGRAVLAALPADTSQRLVQTEWSQQRVSGTWSDFEQLLQRVREEGVAYDLDEHTSGISAAGVAFADWRGALHAISVPIPTPRFEQKKELVRDMLLNIKAQLSAAFGL